MDRVALVAACAAAWLLALRRSLRAPQVVLAALLTFLGLDAVLGLHEHVAHSRLVYLPILAATVLAIGVVAAAGLERVAVRVLIAGVLLLSASLVLHMLGEWLMARLGATPESSVYRLKVGLKHGTEAAGWVLVALSLGHGAIRRPRGRGLTRRAGMPTRG
jgi:hypothetical protein